MKYINKSLVWTPLPGMKREEIVEELTKSSVGIADKGDHIWAAMINNLGTILYCFALQVDEHNLNGRIINAWFVKRIPEAAGPDVYDCPQDIIDMCKTTNIEWRREVLQRLTK